MVVPMDSHQRECTGFVIDSGGQNGQGATELPCLLLFCLVVLSLIVDVSWTAFLYCLVGMWLGSAWLILFLRRMFCFVSSCIVDCLILSWLGPS